MTDYTEENYPSESPPPRGKGPPPKPSVDEEAAESPTALVPKSCLGDGVKVGDTVSMRVVADHGDECEVSMTSNETEEEPAKSPDEELDEMDTEE